MAAFTATQNGNWDASATWGGAGVPGVEDTVDLDTFHVTANVVSACASLVGGASSELILTKNNFTCAGVMTLDNVAVTTAADMEGITLSASEFDIGTDGSLTLSDDLILDADLEIDGGGIDTGGNVLALTGDLIRTSGTFTELNVDHTGPADAAFILTMDHWNIVSGVITQTGGCICRELTVASGATLAEGPNTSFVDPEDDDFLSLIGTVTQSGNGTLAIRVADTNRSNAGRIVCPLLTVRGNDGITFTATGTVTATTTIIRGEGDGLVPVYIIGSAGQDLGDVILGQPGGANRAGGIDFGAFGATLASLVTGLSSDDTTPNTIDFGSGILTLAGTIDGESAGDGPVDMTVISDGAVVKGGQLDNVNCTGRLWAIHGVTDGGGNSSDVRFFPDSMILGSEKVGAILARRA